MTLRIAFEASDLYPERAGLYTYASQLLQHLAHLADPPSLTLLDGQGRGSLQKLLDANDGRLPTTRYARARAWPLLHLSDGPWRKDYRTRRLAYEIDAKMLMPLWGRADSVPPLARWRLPHDVARRLDLCHWPFEDVFLPLPGVAHVATVHDLIALRCPQWHTPAYTLDHTRKLRRIARYATRLIAISEHTKRDLVALLGVSPGRIDVIPEAAGPEFRPPADPAAARDVLARYGLAQGRYVFFVGIISERKNVVRLAQALKAAVEGRTGLTDVKLVLAGSKGWLSGPIYQGLDAVGLGDRLVLPGRVPQADLPALLAGAGAVAYVSLYEGFGLPPLEALACGAAVVASSTTSLPEVVGDAGLLVDPEDVGDIAGALGRVLTDGALRAELRAKGLRRAAQFSWAKTAALTLQTYERAVASLRSDRAERIG